LVLLFRSINRHYRRLGAALRLMDDVEPEPRSNTMVVLVGGIHRGTVAGIGFAKSLHPDRLMALHIADSEESGQVLAKAWPAYESDIELRVVVDPYRNLRRTALRAIEEIDAESDADQITVVIPEFVVHRWWEHLLHNQAALFLKGSLLFRDNVVVVSVPYQVPRDEHNVPTTTRPS
jgi:hypothetical protein